MKKLIVRIIHKSVEYSSDVFDCEDELEQKIINLVSDASSGKLSNLHFHSGQREIYFSKQILQESIIEIVILK